MNDHDRIVGLCTDMCWLKKMMGNHLKHHWMVTIASLTAALGAIVTVIVVLVTR